MSNLRRRRTKRAGLGVDTPVSVRNAADRQLISKLRLMEEFRLNVEPYLDDAELENLHSMCTFDDLVRNEQSFYSRICGGYGFMKAEFGLGSTGSKHYCGSPWLINCYLEGNEQLRRNLEALVANGAIVSALFLTVTLPVIFESDGSNYLLDEDSLDEHGEEMRIFGTIFVYSIFCSTLCFQMALAAAAEFYYHFLAFSANDLDILMMISAHRVSYFVAVPLCGMWSMAGSFFLFTAMTMKACVLSSFSTNLKLGLIAPAVIFLLLNLKSAAMTGKAAWATEWLGELQIANCYRQDKDGNWSLKDPYRQLVGKVEIRPTIRRTGGSLDHSASTGKKRSNKGEENISGITLPPVMTISSDSPLLTSVIKKLSVHGSSSGDTVNPAFDGFGFGSTEADLTSGSDSSQYWGEILQTAMPGCTENDTYIGQLQQSGLEVDDIAHLGFDSAMDVLKGIGIDSTAHRVKISNAVLGFEMY